MSSPPTTPMGNLVLFQAPPVENPKRTTTQPKQKATVKSLASDAESELAKTAPSDPSKTEWISERIRKCFDRDRHPTTPEAEAQAAILMASKLLAQYNLTEAEIISKSDNPEDQMPTAGESVVEITHIHSSTKVKNFAFTGTLVQAMMTFFGCKAYLKSQDHSHKHVFYGVGNNTVAAAMAFEMCYNLISHWAAEKKGVSARHSYSIRIAEGLYDLAVEEKVARSRENSMQLIIVDPTHIADEYLKSTEVRLSNASRRTTPAKDRSAFEAGQKDSKKIIVKGKRLE